MSKTTDTWIQFDEFKGGIAVSCDLCGRKITRQTFWATNLNHAEMYRMAVAYESTHRHSEMHSAALRAFHSEDAPEPDAEEFTLASIFSIPLPTEHELRRRMAKTAARAALRLNANAAKEVHP